FATLQIVEITVLLCGRAECWSQTVFQLARRKRANTLKTASFGRSGGDRKDNPPNKACALYALQPPPSTNWNKWNKRQLRPPQVEA
ncbi:MAG: hypothetical protein WAN72_17150, partial [Candidatus Acidiferrales bacterium]